MARQSQMTHKAIRAKRNLSPNVPILHFMKKISGFGTESNYKAQHGGRTIFTKHIGSKDAAGKYIAGTELYWVIKGIPVPYQKVYVASATL